MLKIQREGTKALIHDQAGDMHQGGGEGPRGGGEGDDGGEGGEWVTPCNAVKKMTSVYVDVHVYQSAG